MDNALFGIPKFDIYAVIGILVFFSAVETITGLCIIYQFTNYTQYYRSPTFFQLLLLYI
jgi:hypothetical protein